MKIKNGAIFMIKKLDMYIPNLPRLKKFTTIIFILLILSIFSGIVLSFLDLSSYDKIKFLFIMQC